MSNQDYFPFYDGRSITSAENGRKGGRPPKLLPGVVVGTNRIIKRLSPMSFICEHVCGHVRELSYVSLSEKRKYCSECYRRKNKSNHDLVGEVFGTWKITSVNEKNKLGVVCTGCGFEKDTFRCNLLPTTKLNKCKQCISIRAEKIRNKILKNKFNKLTPLAALKRGHRWGFVCECDCGEKMWIRQTYLVQRRSKGCRSCGRNDATYARHFLQTYGAAQGISNNDK